MGRNQNRALYCVNGTMPVLRDGGFFLRHGGACDILAISKILSEGGRDMAIIAGVIAIAVVAVVVVVAAVSAVVAGVKDTLDDDA